MQRICVASYRAFRYQKTSGHSPNAGKKLAGLHVNYEQASEYELEEVWKEGSTLDLRVEKMKWATRRGTAPVPFL